MAQQGQPGTAGAGTDPAYVPDREVFGAYTHQQIWDLVQEVLAPAELSRLADTWGHTATAVETAFDEFARDLARFSGDWSGLAAVAAARAAATFVQAGDDAVAVCHVVENLLSADSAAAESVRAAIPPPPSPYLPDPDPAVEAATGARRRTTYNTAAATLTAEAQDAMTFGYNPTIPASGDAVPRFTPPGAGAAEDEPPTAGPPALPDSSAAAPPSQETVAPPWSASPAPDGAQEEPAHDPAPDPGAPVAVRGGESDGSPAAAPRPAAQIAAPESAPTAPPAGTSEPSPDASAPLSSTPASPRDPAALPPDTAAPPPRTTALSSGAVVDPSDSTPESNAAGSADTSPAALSTSTAPTVDRAAADGAGAAGPTRAQGPVPQAAGFLDRGDTSPVPAAVPPRPPASAGWSPAEPAGRADTAPGSPFGGHRPGSVNSSTPATPQATDPDAGAAAVQSEQIARSAPSRPTTEAPRDPFAPTGAGVDPAVTERSEHPWARTVRPSGFPLPAAPGPVPSRTPDRERSSPEYLHAPNEQLTATPPAVPPVFGEYTEAEEPDRTRPGDGKH
ncbi:hypothetical protein [Nocardia sienata]|uniref:hypothetical protein n=1 Tax=Nocardia sienata TaxID=248552 RepID=UPI000B1F590B|nr:hypothetical protein [Nocardia sienata]